MLDRRISDNDHPTLLFLKLCVLNNTLKERFLNDPLALLDEFGLLNEKDEAYTSFNMLPYLLDFPYNPLNLSGEDSWCAYISYLRGVTITSINLDYFGGLIESNSSAKYDGLKLSDDDNIDFFKQKILANIEYFKKHQRSERRFHLINMGMAKSGSTTASALFGNYRSLHEGLHALSVENVLDFKEGITTNDTLNEFLIYRDSILRPEFDGATFYHLIPEQVYQCFPNAKYLLIYRDIGSWILSSLTRLIKIVNGSRQTNESQSWYQRYAQLVFPDHMNWWALFNNDSNQNISLMPLVKSFSELWVGSFLSVIKSIPADKLYLVKLNELSNHETMVRLSQFVGVDHKTILSQCHHMNKESINTLKNMQIQFGLQNMEDITREYETIVLDELKAVS